MKKVILAALATAFTSSAYATAYNFQGEWYTRVGFGITTADTDAAEAYLTDEIATDLGVTENVEIGHPRGYNLNLGYRLNRYIAFELGYNDFGEEETSYTYYSSFGDIETFGREGVITETYKSKVSATAKTLGAVISTDATRTLSGGVRAGYAFWSTGTDVMYYYQEDGVRLNTEDEEVPYSLSRSNVRLKDDSDGGDPFYGGFVNWRIGKWTYSLEHTLFNTDDTDHSTSSISLSMDF